MTYPPCYSCDKLGRVYKRGKTPSGKLRLFLKCYDPKCKFEFDTWAYDKEPSKKAFAQPTWSHVP